MDKAGLALEAVALGAQDYLVKGDLSSRELEHCIRYAVARKAADKHIADSLEEQQCISRLQALRAWPMSLQSKLEMAIASLLSVNWVKEEYSQAEAIYLELPDEDPVLATGGESWTLDQAQALYQDLRGKMKRAPPAGRHWFGLTRMPAVKLA